MSGGAALAAVAPGAYVVDITAGGRGQAYPVVALTSLTTEVGDVITEPVVITSAGQLATPSELHASTWTMRPAGGAR